jgi:photosystem II stability/assembly factor-like uncharacterized protein
VVPVRPEALVTARIASLAAVLLSVAFALRAGTPWEPVGGPAGGFVDFVASSPADPETVYVGSRSGGGIYVSNDAGTTWRAANSGLTETRITALTVSPADPATVYAGTQSGAFKTTDDGASWLPLGGGFPATEVDAIAIDPRRPSNLYVCGGSGALAVSTDAGATWSNIGNEDTTRAQPQRLAIDPQGATVYVATALGGVFWTSDGGRSWDSSTSGLGNIFGDVSSVQAIVVDPTDPRRLYAGTLSDGLFVSTDSGSDWTRLSDGMVYFENPYTGLRFYYMVSDILIQPDGTAYAAAQFSLLVLSPGSSTWTGVGVGIGAINQFALGSGEPPAIYLALGRNVPGDPILANGAFERLDAEGRSYHVFSFMNVRSLATNPFAGGAVVFTANDGFEWTPGERPDAWSEPIDYFGNFSNVLPVSAYFDARFPGVVYAGSGGRVYKSEDGGRTYATGALVGDPRVLPQAVVQTFVAEPGSSGLFAGTTKGLWVSEDSGGSWVAGSPDLASRNVLALAQDASVASTLWAGTDDGVYKSTDSGAHWSKTGRTLDGDVAAVLSVAGGGGVLAGEVAGLFVSTDSGATWTRVPGVDVAVNALVQDPASGLVAAGTAAGVDESVDGGVTWVASNEGLDDPNVLCLSFLEGGALIAGTGDGIFEQVPAPTDRGAAALTALHPRTPTALPERP